MNNKIGSIELWKYSDNENYPYDKKSLIKFLKENKKDIFAIISNYRHHDFANEKNLIDIRIEFHQQDLFTVTYVFEENGYYEVYNFKPTESYMSHGGRLWYFEISNHNSDPKEYENSVGRVIKNDDWTRKGNSVLKELINESINSEKTFKNFKTFLNNKFN